MSDHPSTSTSRTLPPQASNRNAFPPHLSGARSPVVQQNMEEMTPQGAASLSQSLGNGAAWDIWGKPAGLRSSFGTSNNDRREDTYLHAPSNSFESKSATGLFGSDLDAWQKGKTGWTGNTSPALSNVQLQDGISRSPVRFRNNNPQETSSQPGTENHNTRSSSPLVMPRQQGPVGQGLVASHSPNNSLLESSTPLKEPLDFQDNVRGRPTHLGAGRVPGHQRYGTVGQSIDDGSRGASIFGSTLENEDRYNRGRVSSNPRGADILSGNIGAIPGSHRSESLPPQQHRANSTPPDNVPFAAFQQTTHPLSQTQNAEVGLDRSKFDDRDTDSMFRQMGLEDDADQFNAERRRQPFNNYNQNQSVQNPYTRTGEIQYAVPRDAAQQISSQSLWSRPDHYYGTPLENSAPGGLVDPGRQEQYPEFRPNRTFDGTGTFPSIDTNGSDYRRFYANGAAQQPISPTRNAPVTRTHYHGLSMDSGLTPRLFQQPQQTGQFIISREVPLYPGFPPAMQAQYDFGVNTGSIRVPLNPGYPQSPLSPGMTSQSTSAARRRGDDFNLRSVLLEEFRTNSKSKRYELKDIYNHVVEFSGDQHGSRFIQQKLETANSDEKDIVFNEIRPNSIQLMTDVFGNYVIQKFFEHGNQVQKGTLAKQMEGHVLALSLQMYGCRVVQKALEHILTDQQAKLVKELDGNVLKCVKDQNGNHVIQKAIERVPAEHIQFIIKAFNGQVHSLATHPYGCRVIQRMLEHCDETAQASILQELHMCTYALVQDQYGNYVTQHVIEHGKPEDRAKIIQLVTQHLVHASKHKFASNVVEKSIQHGNEEQRKEILKVITTPRASDGASPLQILMRDQFGNYVIQKLLQVLQNKDREYLVEQIKPQIQNLKKFTYGKQINAIEKLIFNSQPTSGANTPPVPSAVSTPPTTAAEIRQQDSHKSSPQAAASSDVAEPEAKSSEAALEGSEAE